MHVGLKLSETQKKGKMGQIGKSWRTTFCLHCASLFETTAKKRPEKRC